MAKLVYGLWLLCALIIQINALEILNGADNTRETESDEEVRFLFNGLAKQCRAKINKVSTILPALQVTLTKLSNNRFYYFSPTAPPALGLSFDNANRFCKEHGMNLVTINSERENELVFSEATARGLTGLAASTGAWIGQRDVTGTSVFKWILTGAINTFNFFNVPPPGAGLCVNYITNTASTPANSWQTTGCGTLLPFICELEPPCSAIL